MATLVLTVAGGAIGGPLGAAIGATLGRTVDREVLFPAARREGPRLTELAVQTSSYGSAIPHLFGTMRVAGTVIWSTDLIEHRSTSGGGKGSAKTTQYSYSVSFAVLLSARPVIAVQRIWADGKLLRGAAGDFKVQTGFRLHRGGEDQAIDPLIAAAEGIGDTPAHRGCAYAVFEDLDLTEYGNRIPSLTFEVVADEASVDIGTIADAVSHGVVSGATGIEVLGYSAYGEDRRAIVEQLAEASGCTPEQSAGRITLHGGVGEASEVADMAARAQGDEANPRSRKIADAMTLPTAMELAHYDPARDYQAGLQRAGSNADGVSRKISLPAALSAQGAKTLAEHGLAMLRAGRDSRQVALDWSAAATPTGGYVTIAGEAGEWRVTGWSLEKMVLTLTLSRAVGSVPQVAASNGRVLPAPDRTIGRTLITVFELPPLDETAWDAPRIGIAACGEGEGWRQAALVLSSDGGASWRELGGSAPPAIMGAVIAPPGIASALIRDDRNTIEIELFASSAVLNHADSRSLDNGANLAMMGKELLQFATAEQLGDRRWRLSGLRRGLRGTERQIGKASAGDRFTLIDRDTLTVAEVPSARIGSTILIRAVGAGDPTTGTQAEVVLDGRSVVPPAPVHLRAERMGGVTTLRWVRRSRTGWRWIDGAGTPLGEDGEQYLFDAGDGGASIELSEPQYLPGGQDWSRAGVAQMGDLGRSPAASFINVEGEKA
ncbi:phage tail protein [Stakelama sp. CBK3Z-3]|uniref:Phage tail protein n=1 Tax=Stakelama flava TaxID=2860338 RepID=A0ABS6XK50_9SPHN|nr:phage tail protein [Stakelama flava]MBW4330572.1 phage tail protein [Stakelama flava]